MHREFQRRLKEARGGRHAILHRGQFKTRRDALRFSVRGDTHPEPFYPVDADDVVQKFDHLPGSLRGNVYTLGVPDERVPGATPPLTEDERDELEAFLNTAEQLHASDPCHLSAPEPNMQRYAMSKRNRGVGSRLRLLPLALAVAAGFASSAARASEASLQAEIAELRAQIEQMKAQLKELAAPAQPAPALPVAAQAAVAAAPTADAPPAPAPSAAQTELATRVDRLEQQFNAQAEEQSATTLWGYGEIAYARPMHDASQAQADLARGVLGWGHRFDERTRMAAELEVEHAVASATDKGEVEFEQFYAERDFTDRIGGRAGLFLIPIGFINEHHEPTQYYSVFRNFVETSIIPTTWREGGLAVYGGTESGLTWNVGLTTGFNLANWDPSSNVGRDSPLGSIHQELSLAAAKDLSGYLALNYVGIPGWTVGGTYFTGKAGQGGSDFPAPNARVTLWEAHARWQPGPFDFTALYARATISDTEALNLTFIGQPTPVPQLFYGGYVQGAWRNAWQYKDYALTPFTRYEWINTAAAYASVPLGLGVAPTPTEQVWTIGADFYVTPSIVFKADYQQFRIDSFRNSVQLGFGLNF